jgi:hypothetical protein
MEGEGHAVWWIKRSCRRIFGEEMRILGQVCRILGVMGVKEGVRVRKWIMEGQEVGE